mgnify:CR=1 FL=1|tara:strand:- start:51 stop:308 length:258 start_codon:yes stop_codon:yes gene_type:complete
MSSELKNHTKTNIEEKKDLLKAEIISFPNEIKTKQPINLNIKEIDTWKLYDKSNIKDDRDQLKAVIGICFMYVTIMFLSIYSNFT